MCDSNNRRIRGPGVSVSIEGALGFSYSVFDRVINGDRLLIFIFLAKSVLAPRRHPIWMIEDIDGR